MSVWNRWVAHCGRLVDPRPLRLTLLFLALCVLGDLADMAWRGALDACLYTDTAGGLAADPANWYLLADHAWGGPAVFAAVVVSALCVAARVQTRLALAVLIVAYAQLGHLFIPGDRGIDRIIRTSLLILICSAVPTRADRIAAWPADLLRWLIMLVYLSAGFAKLGASVQWWWPVHHPELYAILTDPLAAKLDAVFWWDHPAPFVVLGWATMAVELSAPLILTRWSRWWAVFAAPIHLGIAATMHLGMFSWGMLAFYPVLFGPWTEVALDRLGFRSPDPG